MSNTPKSDTQATCVTCGSSIALNGQCAGCLLSLAGSFGVAGEAMLDPFQVREFGDYELLEEIARGGMGVVYRARQRSLDREVAVKMILAGELAGREAIEMFHREAHAAARLHHPNIVPVHEIGEHDGQTYFTMPYVPGGKSIADWAAGREGDEREVATAVAKVARALAHAHQRGILHRDLKPSNILWDPDGEPMVTDFGLAKLLDVESGAATLSAQAIGSPSYMAPEQMGGRLGEITTATDLYGLGAVLYELLSQRPPFRADSAIETMRRAAEEPPEPLDVQSRDLRVICLKCLEKKPGDRYQSATVLAEELERFVRGEPIQARAISAPARAWRLCKRKPLAASLVFAFLTAVVAGGAGVLWQWSRAEEANTQLRETVDRLEWRAIDSLVETGEPGRAVVRLAERMRVDPGDWRAAVFATSILENRSFPIPAALPIQHGGESLDRFQVHPSENRVVTSNNGNNSALVWDLESGRLFAELAHETPLIDVSCHPTKPWVATSSQDGHLRLWDFSEGGKGRLIRKSGTKPYSQCEFAPDGEKLYAMEQSRIAAFKSDLSQIAFHVKGEGFFVVSPDSRKIASVTGKQIMVVDAKEPGDPVKIPIEVSLRGLAYLDGASDRLVSHDNHFNAYVWDAATGEKLRSVDWRTGGTTHEAIYEIAPSPRPDQIGIAFTHRHRSGVWDLATGERKGAWMQQSSGVRALAFNHDGSRILTAGEDFIARLWDGDSHLPIAEPVRFHQSGEFVRFLDKPGGDRFLIGVGSWSTGIRSLQQWRVITPRLARFDDGDLRSQAGAVLSPRGDLVAFADEEHRVTLKERLSGKQLFKAETSDCSQIVFDPDQKWLLAFSEKGAIHLFSIPDGEPLWDGPQRTGRHFRSVAVHPDQDKIALGGWYGDVWIYSLPDMEELGHMKHALPGKELESFVFSLEFSGDGTRLMSASKDGTVREWKVAGGEELRRFEPGGPVTIARYLKDGGGIATSSEDKRTRIWDLDRPEEPRVTIPHAARPAHFDLSPDGERIATGSRDGIARIWSVRSGEPLTPPLRLRREVRTVRFFPDGERLLTVSHRGSRIWDAVTGEPLTVLLAQGAIESHEFVAADRSVIRPDGSGFLVGSRAEQVVYWDATVPPTPIPDWFPDFLEAIAMQRADATGTMQTLSIADFFKAKARAEAADGWYGGWARRYLGKK